MLEGREAMLFCGSRSMIRAARGADDSLNNILAAGAAGSFFKLTAGIRPALQWGGLGAAVAATFVLALELRSRMSSLVSGGMDRVAV
ncbi:MAG: hypothetical protein BJ554DRAFT_5629 [Olpidium bornovanus]|uniref:Uncharacterized protein n=1 Tax=Olpidium bornovanus TaxID=278681 RepID=A0A8H8DKV8_9FUNG|nr:MAG: hypothetical protein BJ554DRAFT_5629 [Olpidium bornovanus]